MKKTVSMLLALLLALSCCAALAEDVPPPDQISPDLTSSFVSWTNPIAVSSMGLGDGVMANGDDGLKISFVEAGISKLSATSIFITATTEANMKCLSVGGVMVLQRWSNNTWNYYYSYGFEADNKSSCSASTTKTVESGYYYRLRVTHKAETAYSTKIVYSTTHSVYAN